MHNMMHSWTIITWIVVFGSSVVMLIWIVIYSFFESYDFVNEVLILYGGLKFWTTVVITVATGLSESSCYLRRTRL